MPRTRYKLYGQGCPHFLSSTIVNWIPLFSYPDQVEILLSSLRFLHDEHRLRLHGYVIMENHFHLVASSPYFETDVGSLKSYSVKGFFRLLDSKRHRTRLDELRLRKLRHKKRQTYQVWQKGYYPQQISSYEMLLQKLDYMHNNPVLRGYVDDPARWRYSSYRNYNGMEGVLQVEPIVYVTIVHSGMRLGVWIYLKLQGEAKASGSCVPSLEAGIKVIAYVIRSATI